jgi:hypothetical protein
MDVVADFEFGPETLSFSWEWARRHEGTCLSSIGRTVTEINVPRNLAYFSASE